MPREQQGLMRKINTARVIKGGLLAGLVINVGGFISSELLLKDQWDAALYKDD
jgi:hypothetical protein